MCIRDRNRIEYGKKVPSILGKMYKPTKLRKSHQGSPVKCSAKNFQSNFFLNVKWEKTPLFILFFLFFPLSSRRRDARGTCAARRLGKPIILNKKQCREQTW